MSALSKTSSDSNEPSDLNGVTGELCEWVISVKLGDIPPEVRTRSKYLILDGIACALVGAHLPWSETAANTMFEFEGTGNCTVFGWDKKLGPLAAALLNSSFLQGFELDDFHSEAPLHSDAILLPALLAAAEIPVPSGSNRGQIDGKALLLATIVGYEIGPRVGRALYGAHMLSRGWHSGVVFGHPAAAASTAKLLGLSGRATEDAIGIACTQTCGLMSAQFESMVKRMQHGFAARNGLFATLMARGGYKGIERVFERPYGGFLAAFSSGSGKTPEYLENEVTKQLGRTWETLKISAKAYAAMGGIHGTIDCISHLQAEHPEQMADFDGMQSIIIEMGRAAFHHGGWKAEERPLSTTGAQMNASYCAAIQLVDKQVLPLQFGPHELDRDILWDLMAKTTCVHNTEFDEPPTHGWETRVTVSFGDSQPKFSASVARPTGVEPLLSNDEIRDKYRALTANLLDEPRQTKIEEMVLGLEDLSNIADLVQLLAPRVPSALESKRPSI